MLGLILRIVILGKLEWTKNPEFIIYLTVGINFVSIDKVSINIKRVVKGKIWATLTIARIDNTKKVLAETLHNEMGDVNNNINSTDINKLTITRGLKEEFSILSILAMVIADKRLTKNA